jgi:hypothetical protein
MVIKNLITAKTETVIANNRRLLIKGNDNIVAFLWQHQHESVKARGMFLTDMQ